MGPTVPAPYLWSFAPPLPHLTPYLQQSNLPFPWFPNTLLPFSFTSNVLVGYILRTPPHKLALPPAPLRHEILHPRYNPMLLSQDNFAILYRLSHARKIGKQKVQNLVKCRQPQGPRRRNRPR
jgi:hypothetical protein